MTHLDEVTISCPRCAHVYRDWSARAVCPECGQEASPGTPVTLDECFQTFEARCAAGGLLVARIESELADRVSEAQNAGATLRLSWAAATDRLALETTRGLTDDPAAAWALLYAAPLAQITREDLDEAIGSGMDLLRAE
jgi:hypothetical protein